MFAGKKRGLKQQLLGNEQGRCLETNNAKLLTRVLNDPKPPRATTCASTYLDFTGADVFTVHLVQGANHALDVVELHEGEHLVGLLVLDVDILTTTQANLY